MAIGKTFVQILGPDEQFPNNPGFVSIFLQKQADVNKSVFGFNDGYGNTFASFLTVAKGTAPGNKLSKIFDVNASTPNNGDRLVYSAATGQWVNQSTDILINSQSGDSYVLNLIDKDNLLEIATAAGSILVIPNNSATTFSIGSQFLIYQADAGQIQFSGDTEVTLISSGNKNKTSVSGSTASLIKIAINNWLLSGDITV
jgi:hypothetical protein